MSIQMELNLVYGRSFCIVFFLSVALGVQLALVLVVRRQTWVMRVNTFLYVFRCACSACFSTLFNYIQRIRVRTRCGVVDGVKGKGTAWADFDFFLRGVMKAFRLGLGFFFLCTVAIPLHAIFGISSVFCFFLFLPRARLLGWWVLCRLCVYCFRPRSAYSCCWCPFDVGVGEGKGLVIPALLQLDDIKSKVEI
ncbi:hypothetical protein B0T21DRAFT_62832 [Apiosordaria backusii]|uniref:Transmembrane protein n=1 Tax=Apiosordaria backusii TaxID=314023 RepID=A0AA40DUX7_9PEZI|nr:hypothetical protein B0T21DRAFT_62832 [Apiosordaria backusii]